MSGDAQSGSAFHLLPAVSHKLKNPCPACRLREGIMCGMAQCIPVLSVLHWQKDRCFKEQKICGSSSALPAGNNVWQGAGCSSQECSAFAEGPLLGRCRESCAGTGCRLSELDTLPVSRIFQCELRQAVPNLAQIFRPLQKAARTSKQQKHSGWHCPASPQPRIPPGTAPRPSTQNLPAGTPSHPFK